MSQVCSNCLQTRDVIHFQEPTRSYKTCDKCRTNRKRRRTHSAISDVQQQTSELIPTIINNNNSNTNNNNTNDISGSSSLSNSDNNNNTIALVTLENLNENFAALTMHQVEGYDYEARISLDDTLLGLNDMDIAKLLCHKMGECDTYKYILKTVNPSTARKGVASFYANCSQSMALAKSKPNNGTTSPDQQQQQRRRNSKQRKRFDCKGRVSASIDRIARQAHVIIQHDIRHEPPGPSRKTPNEVRALIQRETIMTGRSAKDIHADVRQQFPDLNITPAQVYYWWREFKQEVAEMSSTITNTNTNTISSSTLDNNNNNNTIIDSVTKKPKTCE